MNLNQVREIMSQAKDLQGKVQEKLAHTVVEGSAGGGAVLVKMNGKKEVLAVTIDASAAASNGLADIEMLQDLIVAACNDAGRRADEAMRSNLSGMLGGLDLPPGLMG
jgi:DNA-binding YbaB/EbfC family protein